MAYAVESLPPEYTPGTDPYLDSIRQQHDISAEAQGQEARDRVRNIWELSLTGTDGFADRIQLMEILMGDRVDGQEIGSLGYLYFHLQKTGNIRIVPRWRSSR
jgi:hypothetical protein